MCAASPAVPSAPPHRCLLPQPPRVCSARLPPALQARDLITKLLVKEPSARLPLSEVANHKWILDNVEA